MWSIWPLAAVCFGFADTVLHVKSRLEESPEISQRQVLILFWALVKVNREGK